MNKPGKTALPPSIDYENNFIIKTPSENYT